MNRPDPASETPVPAGSSPARTQAVNPLTFSSPPSGSDLPGTDTPLAAGPSHASAQPFRAETDGAAPVSRVSAISTLPGGVMTDEAGVITGQIDLETSLSPAGAVTMRARYTETDEWYAVSGVQVSLHDPADLEALHHLAVQLLHRPE